MSKLCVLGMGYIGLPTALLFANNGHEVVGVDVKESVVQTLNQGRMPFEEEGFQELLDKVIEKKTFKATTEVEEADVFLVAVPTPFDAELKMADLKYVISACRMITPHLKKDNLVIIESTIPPKTCSGRARKILEQSGLEASRDFYISHCPERAIPGNTHYEMVNNDRVIGGIDEISTEITRNLYSSFVKGNLYLTNSNTAEMVKLMENTYRDVNIALANELAKIAEDYEVNVWDAIEIANRHPRVNIHKPGPGVGGHCIAIDPWFLTEVANNDGLIMLARQVNDSMPVYVMKKVQEMVKDIPDPTITVFGVAYKGDIGDTRATPARKFIKLAEKEGYNVKIYDPYVEEFEWPILSLEESVENSDCIVVLTDHSEFRNIDPHKITNYLSRLNIFDSKNALDLSRWKDAGFYGLKIGETD
jgi:UDP-N-acetyl-D-mannosaminuronic acid dehydrogenase